MTASLRFVEVNPKSEVKALVIWMHGLGDSGHGFAPIVPSLNLPDSLGVRFVFPHAPERPITINGGAVMRGWYDIASFDLENRADESGVRESAELLEQLINDELSKGIQPEKLVLAGFSQGGVMAYHIGTRFQDKLAGIMALSTYMCAPHKLADEMSKANLATPVFAAHGRMDEIVPLAAGKMAVDTMQSVGYQVEWQEYFMQHNVCPEEIQHVSAWLQKVLTD